MIEITGLTKRFRTRGASSVAALDEIDLRIPDGAAIGLVGESGSGKSTLLRCLLRLERADGGTIAIDGRDITRLRGRGLAAYRRDVQMVFQDPMASLNPRMTVRQLVEEGMIVHHRGMSFRRRLARVDELLERVGLDPAHRDRLPASFSGGQRQRIAIARALAVEPRVLVCDEPVAALDVSIQAQVLNLLADMNRNDGLTLLFVAHDLAVVSYLCDEISVLRQGRIVEHASRDVLFTAPQAPYTRELIAAAPHQAALRSANDYTLTPTQPMEV
jgi:ABC-type oligopeptide transport system ATPase subunit